MGINKKGEVMDFSFNVGDANSSGSLDSIFTKKSVAKLALSSKSASAWQNAEMCSVLIIKIFVEAAFF